MTDNRVNKRSIEEIESEIYSDSEPDYEKIGSTLIEVMKRSEDPAEFFRMAMETGVLEKILPELSRLKGIPAGPVEHHREDCFEHSMMVLDEMYKLRGNDVTALLMALFHDLGKGETPKNKLPKHYNHGERGVKIAEEIADRFFWKDEYKEAIKAGCREHMRILNLNRMQPQKVVGAVEDMINTDIENIVALILDLVTADERGRIASTPSKDFDREEIKDIIDGTLPNSAYEYNAWWSNDETHSQAKAWLDAGYRVSSFDIIKENVTFVESGKTGQTKKRSKKKVSKKSSNQKEKPNEKVTGGVALVSCTKKKRTRRSKPKELYMESPYFRKMRRYSEKYHDDWYILSAKHHLLNPEGPAIEPYDDTLKTASKKEKIQWSKKVFQQLKEKGLLDEKLYIHAGKDYYEYLRPLLEEAGVDFEMPTKGLRFGKTQAWYKKHI